MHPNSLANLKPAWRKGQSGNPGRRPRRQPITEALASVIGQKEAEQLAGNVLVVAVAKDIVPDIPGLNDRDEVALDALALAKGHGAPGGGPDQACATTAGSRQGTRPTPEPLSAKQHPASKAVAFAWRSGATGLRALIAR